MKRTAIAFMLLFLILAYLLRLAKPRVPKRKKPPTAGKKISIPVRHGKRYQRLPGYRLWAIT